MTISFVLLFCRLESANCLQKVGVLSRFRKVTKSPDVDIDSDRQTGRLKEHLNLGLAPTNCWAARLERIGDNRQLQSSNALGGAKPHRNC